MKKKNKNFYYNQKKKKKKIQYLDQIKINMKMKMIIKYLHIVIHKI